MRIYEVVEYITEDYQRNGQGENASGMYSTPEKARQAVLERMAEVYEQDEISAMNIPDDWEYLEVPDNEYVAGCTYIMNEYKLDERME